MTLTEFLLARIAEREAVARLVIRSGSAGRLEEDEPWFCDEQSDHVALAPARVLRRCEADRRIVYACTTPLPRFGELPENYDRVPTSREDVLRLLALPYADHPNYQEDWKP